MNGKIGVRNMGRVASSNSASIKAMLVGIIWACVFSPILLAQTDFNIKAQSSDLKGEFQKELDKWMLRAYDGDRDAQFKVGVLFANEQFGKPDHEQSVYWYKQAARQGHVLAQYNLGHQYLIGVGAKRDEVSAMQWWLKAAHQEHALAQFNIGRAYYLGIGLQKDLPQAKLWFERAAQNKEPKSIEILQQLGWWTEQDVAENAATVSAQKVDTAKPDVTQTQASVEVAAEPEETARDRTSSKVVLSASNKSSAALKPTTTAQTKPTTEATNKPRNTSRSLAIFTNPAVRSVLITIVDGPKDLVLVSEQSPWSLVRSKAGFPVWVHKNFAKTDAQTAIITATSVNARSVPLITKGSIVGRLNKNEQLDLLDTQGDWFRVTSPARFQGWVKTADFLTARADALEPGTKKASKAPPANSQKTIKENSSGSTPSSVNNNEWLFAQEDNHYTMQLASFDDQLKVDTYMEKLPFKDSPELRLFTSMNDSGVKWTYFLYGLYDNDATAKQARIDLKQTRAWIRNFGTLQQNRCIAWKKELPAPKELNKYCVK